MTAACSVCGGDCGPLRGAAGTRSWRCAGLLARRNRASFALRDQLRVKYGNLEKQASREALREDLLALPPNARVLDLYGGGLSAEWIRAVRSDVEVWSAESDPNLWPALARDAAAGGYHPIFGDFKQAEAFFDFIWLDLCGEIVTAHEPVQAACHLLPRRPWPLHRTSIRDPHCCVLYITVMNQDRGGHRELHRDIRDIAIAAVLENAARSPLSAQRIHSYRQAGGRGLADLWRIGASYAEQVADNAGWLREAAAGRARHERAVAFWWEHRRGYRVESHARGACKCADNDYITLSELWAERDRWDLQADSAPG